MINAQQLTNVLSGVFQDWTDAYDDSVRKYTFTGLGDVLLVEFESGAKFTIHVSKMRD